MRPLSTALVRIAAGLVLAAGGLSVSADGRHHHEGGETHAHHADRVVDMSPGAAPTLSVTLEGTAAGGFEAVLRTGRFRFAREHADGPHVPGEGHAHLYIDGVKIGRIYEPSARLPPLTPGAHEIRIALYTNDHAAYAAEGVPVAERFVVKVPARPQQGARGPLQVFTLPVANGHIESGQRTLRVEQGDMVELRWTSSEPKELHLHGYDIEARVSPDAPVTMRFAATITGRFPVEEHGEGGGHRHGALVYLEVYPR